MGNRWRFLACCLLGLLVLTATASCGAAADQIIPTIRPTVTFLNLDKNYPNSPFSVVIFHGKSSFYGDANALKGKSIEIKGQIKNYHDKPEIILDSTNQLTVFNSKGVNITATILQSTNHTPAMPQKTNAVPVTAPALTNFPEIM